MADPLEVRSDYDLVEERPEITHPERLIWPSLGIQKIDLVHYCERVMDWLLPQVADRPLTLVRCPDGAEAKCFYQRHLGGSKEYIHIDDARALLNLVQNGVVEFHTWGAKVRDTRHPDRITLDLDPDPELPWKKLREATKLTRTMVEGLGLRSFLKTTGGKGLHVVVPIEPRLPWAEVKEFSHRMAQFLVRARPDLFISTIAKAERTGKVFVDYLRNSETASAVAAYSSRARPGATVSTPLSWDELDATDLRAKFTVKSVPQRLARLREDPWKDYAKTRQAISASMRRALKI